ILSSFPLYKVVRQEYIPSGVDEGEFFVTYTAPEGTSLPANDQVMRAIEQELSQVRGVRTVLATAGGGFAGSVNNGNIHVSLAPHEERYFSIARLWCEALRGNPLGAFRGNYTQRDVQQEIRRRLAK